MRSGLTHYCVKLVWKPILARYNGCRMLQKEESLLPQIHLGSYCRIGASGSSWMSWSGWIWWYQQSIIGAEVLNREDNCRWSCSSHIEVGTYVNYFRPVEFSATVKSMSLMDVCQRPIIHTQLLLLGAESWLFRHDFEAKRALATGDLTLAALHEGSCALDW